jgi:TerB-C domain
MISRPRSSTLTRKEPVAVQRPTAPARLGEAIPTRPGGNDAIQLDESLLRRILGETHEIARILGEAMREIEPEPGELALEVSPVQPTRPPAPPPPPPTDARFECLDPRFHAVLAELLMRRRWSRNDFEALVRRHQLMPSGTIDTINEWAQDRLDDLIIEDGGDDLVVNTNLVWEQS